MWIFWLNFFFQKSKFSLFLIEFYYILMFFLSNRVKKKVQIHQKKFKKSSDFGKHKISNLNWRYIFENDIKTYKMKKFNQKQQKIWFLRKTILRQKIHILAHSGGRNITEIIFWHILLFLSHCESKHCIKCVKSPLKMVNFFRKSWKISTMGRFLKKKAITIFFKYTFLECGEGPQQHPIERYLEVWTFKIST
jgi:hypothetical protein